MVALTERAGALLQRMQTAQLLPATLRMVVSEGELVVGTSAATPNDEVLFYDGVPVLRLSAEAAAALAGCTVTTRDTDTGPSLAIVVPEDLDDGAEAARPGSHASPGEAGPV